MIRRVAWLLIAGVILLGASGGRMRAAADPATALGDAETAVDQARGATGAERDQLVQHAIQAIDGAFTGSGRDWLRAPLTESPPNLDEARARLTAARDVLRQQSPGAIPSDRSRAALEAALADPRLHPRTLLSFVPGWLLPVALLAARIVQVAWQIITWPFDRLLDLLDRTLSGPAGRPLLVALGLAAFVGLALLFRRSLRSTLVRQMELSGEAAALPPTASEARAMAGDYARQGDFREACHYVFLATLLWIEEHGGPRVDRAATNREQLARIAAAPGDLSPEIATRLAPIVARFDRIWYGQTVVDAADYEDLLGLAERVEEVAV